MFNGFCLWHNAGVEARGFIFGPPIALAIGAKFVPMRKPKKLPGICFAQLFFYIYHYVYNLFRTSYIADDYGLRYLNLMLHIIFLFEVLYFTKLMLLLFLWWGRSLICLNGRVSIIFSGEVISEEYSLEYGTDKIEMHVGAVQPGERALVIDDLIATGGTLCAAIKLLGKLVDTDALLTKKTHWHECRGD